METDKDMVTVKMLREALAQGCQCGHSKLTAIPDEETPDYHYHRTEDGFFVRCYHAASKSILTNWKFWAVLLISFPVEHYIWTKVYPFTLFAGFLGLD